MKYLDVAIRYLGLVLLFFGWAFFSLAVGFDGPLVYIGGALTGFLGWWVFDPFYQRKDRII